MEGVSILSVSTILRLDFGSVLTHTACYFCFFISLSVITKYLKRKGNLLTFKTTVSASFKELESCVAAIIRCGNQKKNKRKNPTVRKIRIHINTFFTLLPTYPYISC